MKKPPIVVIPLVVIPLVVIPLVVIPLVVIPAKAGIQMSALTYFFNGLLAIMPAKNEKEGGREAPSGKTPIKTVTYSRLLSVGVANRHAHA